MRPWSRPPAAPRAWTSCTAARDGRPARGPAVPAPQGRRVAVIADGGGHASLACDLAEAHGLQVPAFGAPLDAALRAALPPSAGTSNPVDVAGAGEQDVGVFARTLDLVLAAPEADAAIVTGWFGAYGEYGPAMAAAEIAAAEAMAAGAAAQASRSHCTRWRPRAGPPACCERRASRLPGGRRRGPDAGAARGRRRANRPRRARPARARPAGGGRRPLDRARAAARGRPALPAGAPRVTTAEEAIGRGRGARRPGRAEGARRPAQVRRRRRRARARVGGRRACRARAHGRAPAAARRTWSSGWRTRATAWS